MRMIMLVAAGLAASSAAAQQPESGRTDTASFPDGWEGRISATFRPIVGRDLPAGIVRDTKDESDGELALSLKRPLAGNLDIQIRLGATFAPNYFDEDDPQSGLYAQIGIGERADLLTGFRSLGTDEISRHQDTITPYARYRYIRGYEGFFERPATNDHRFTVGLTYQDIRGVMCSDEEWRRLEEAADLEGLCAGDRGLYWRIDGNFNLVESTDPLRERSFAAVGVKAVSRPLRGVRFFAEVGAEAHFYSNERVATGARREDRLARVTLGVDASRPFARLMRIGRRRELEASIGARWERNWSNRADKRYERGFLVPTLALSTGF
jgi:hypothetical protein